jgi:hypothetical protein
MTTSTQTATVRSTPSAAATPRTPATELLFGSGAVLLVLMAMPGLLGAWYVSALAFGFAFGVVGLAIGFPVLAALVVSPTIAFVVAARRTTTAGGTAAWLVACVAAAALPAWLTLSLIA